MDLSFSPTVLQVKVVLLWAIVMKHFFVAVDMQSILISFLASKPAKLGLPSSSLTLFASWVLLVRCTRQTCYKHEMQDHPSVFELYFLLFFRCSTINIIMDSFFYMQIVVQNAKKRLFVRFSTNVSCWFFSKYWGGMLFWLYLNCEWPLGATRLIPF